MESMSSTLPYIYVGARDSTKGIGTLSNLVTEKLREGYVLQGGISVDGGVCYQALSMSRGGTRRQRSRKQSRRR